EQTETVGAGNLWYFGWGHGLSCVFAVAPRHNGGQARVRINVDQLTVYVVDDSKDAADSLATLLGLMGHRARPFYGAEDALLRAQTDRPDCVMLGIAMGGLDGLELARRFREQFNDDVILVAITGSPADDPRVKATFVTVDHYFQKPVTLEQIQKLFPA